MTAATDPTTDEALAFALVLADEADGIALAHYRGGELHDDLGIERKADGSLVTLADRAVEAHLRMRIVERFPSHAILGEEQGHTPAAEGAARWILDPIDGTHSFARGIPVWATLIAFERDGTIEAGVASAPALGTRWWAARGLGAWRMPLPPGVPASTKASPRGITPAAAAERIAVSSVDRIEEAQVLYGSHRLALARWPRGFESLLASAWRTRGYGDFWGHCLVAEGSAEVMLEGEISAWDIAALQVIVEEAGGSLTDDAGARTIDAGHSVTSNAALHDQLLDALRG